jgi:hypothetical protein
MKFNPIHVLTETAAIRAVENGHGSNYCSHVESHKMIHVTAVYVNAGCDPVDDSDFIITYRLDGVEVDQEQVKSLLSPHYIPFLTAGML